MMENDPLDSVLHEWQAPPPPTSLDARVLAAYRQSVRPALWRRFLQARVTIPVPVIAILILILAVVLIRIRIDRRSPLPQIGGYVTRIESAGFQPLPEGDARIVRREEVRP
jgi:hypothetical protein